MSLKLSEKDHHTLDEHLNKVLDAYKNDKISQLKARSELAHVISAAAQDNAATMDDVRAFLSRLG